MSLLQALSLVGQDSSRAFAGWYVPDWVGEGDIAANCLDTFV